MEVRTTIDEYMLKKLTRKENLVARASVTAPAKAALLVVILLTVAALRGVRALLVLLAVS